MNPIHEIIVLANPDRLIGDTYNGYCPLHDEPNPVLQFEDAGNRVKLFCHSCHYSDKTVENILFAWLLGPENLYIAREMNPNEKEIILCKSNMRRLALKARNLEGQDLDKVRSKYKSIISEQLIWCERFEKTKM